MAHEHCELWVLPLMASSSSLVTRCTAAIDGLTRNQRHHTCEAAGCCVVASEGLTCESARCRGDGVDACGSENRERENKATCARHGTHLMVIAYSTPQSTAVGSCEHGFATSAHRSHPATRLWATHSATSASVSFLNTGVSSCPVP